MRHALDVRARERPRQTHALRAYFNLAFLAAVVGTGQRRSQALVDQHGIELARRRGNHQWEDIRSLGTLRANDASSSGNGRTPQATRRRGCSSSGWDALPLVASSRLRGVVRAGGRRARAFGRGARDRHSYVPDAETRREAGTGRASLSAAPPLRGASGASSNRSKLHRRRRRPFGERWTETTSALQAGHRRRARIGGRARRPDGGRIDLRAHPSAEARAALADGGSPARAVRRHVAARVSDAEAAQQALPPLGRGAARGQGALLAGRDAARARRVAERGGERATRPSRCSPRLARSSPHSARCPWLERLDALAPAAV